MSVRPARLVVVVGTGTEVGKTWVTADAARRLRAQSLVVRARKPAQSFEPGDPPAGTDAALLADATGDVPERVCPHHRWYSAALAPPMAADSLGRRRIHLAELLGEVDGSWGGAADGPARTDIGLVELAGGAFSPIAHDADCIEMAAGLQPDLNLLVADPGLGTISAVRPAAAALAAVAPVVVVLNRFDRHDEIHRRNLEWLREIDGLDVVENASALLSGILQKR